MSIGARTALLAVLAFALPAFADHVPGLTDDEETCQQKTAKALAKVQSSAIKCLVKCDKGAARGKNPDSDCAPPYGGATVECLAKADGKATTAIAKGCADDCPECYDSGDCAARGELFLTLIGGAVDAGVPELACDDSGSDDGFTAPERACRQAAALQAAKGAQKVAKCLTKCRAREAAGSIPLGSCTPPAIDDLETEVCIEVALGKCVVKAEKKCADPPECLGDLFFICVGPMTVVQGFDPLVFCGS